MQAMQALRQLSLRSMPQQLRLRGACLGNSIGDHGRVGAQAIVALRTQTEIMCRVGAQAMQGLHAWLGAQAMQAMRHCVSCTSSEGTSC